MLLVVVEAEDVEAWHLGAAFAVGLPVGVELGDVEALHAEGVAERQGNAEVEDVEGLRFADAVGLLVGVESEVAEALWSGDVTERLEDAEAEEGAVGLFENVEIEEGVVELLEGVEVEIAAVLQLETSAVKTLVLVEATQVFELAFGCSDCSPDSDLAVSLQDSYSLPGQEREPLLETGGETGGAADCQMARDHDQAERSGVLEDNAEARLLRADSDCPHEVVRVSEHLELAANLARLVREALLHHVDEYCLTFVGRWD